MIKKNQFCCEDGTILPPVRAKPYSCGSPLPAAAPQSAVCEALNLSLRPTPAIPQLNGSTFPASVSIQRHHHYHHSMQRSLYPQHTTTLHQHQTPSSNTVTLVAQPPLHTRFKREEEDREEDEEFKENAVVVHPEMMVRSHSDCPVPVAIAIPEPLHYTASDSSTAAPAAAMDLVCVTEKKPTLLFSTEADFHPPSGLAHATPTPITENVTVAPSSTPSVAPAFKSSKIYPCQECYKVFRHPMSLHHHRHVHKGTYTCHSCGKVFSRRWDLHRHIHRSKMGCRRPNHHTSTNSTSTTPNSHGLTVSSGPPAALRQPQDHPSPYDLNNPPSN